MADELNFKLPRSKQRRSISNVLMVILLLAVLAVSGANLWILIVPGDSNILKNEVLGPAQLEELAQKLAARNLPAAAAGVWTEYLQTGALDDEQRARVLYRIGDLLLKAEKPQEAIGYFYRSEMVRKLPDLEEQITAKLQECFEQAGRFAALRYEIMERTSYQPKDDESQVVVAEMGPEKITAAELDALIEEQIDAQLRQYAALTTPEQINQQKESLMAQITSPQQKLQFLQAMMMEQALYREALAQELDEETSIKQRMRRLTQQFLAQQLLEKQVTPKINITNSDMQTYYQANINQYLSPARARISHIQLAQKEQAQQVIEKLNQGENFADLARELSLDENTKETGGEIAEEITVSQDIPTIGRSEQLEQKIFASAPDTVLAEPIEGENGWHVILVRNVTAEQQQPYQQVEQEIYQTLHQQKNQELQQLLIDELMDKYDIVIHREALVDKQTPK